jgi:hypothetical protein
MRIIFKILEEATRYCKRIITEFVFRPQERYGHHKDRFLAAMRFPVLAIFLPLMFLGCSEENSGGAAGGAVGEGGVAGEGGAGGAEPVATYTFTSQSGEGVSSTSCSGGWPDTLSLV